MRQKGYTFFLVWNFLKGTTFCLLRKILKREPILGFAGGAVVENLPANAGDTGLSPGLGRSHMLRSN